MIGNYWNQALDSRISRRRALTATGATALGAAFLAACGGGGKSNSPKAAVSGLLTEPVDETKQAKRGGAWLDWLVADFPTMDPHRTSNPHPSNYAFSRLTRMESGFMGPPKGTFLMDAAESMEFSPDKLQVTAKLRQNLKWHNIAPVNGRNITAQDVVFSFDRMAEVGTNRGDFLASMGGPIESLKAVDDKTITIKLSKVYSAITALLASGGSGALLLLPTEAASKYDPRTVAIGSGPWMMKDYKPSIGVTWARHEGWHSPELLNVDEVRGPIVNEYAQGLAQFNAGAIYNYPVRGEDILQTKKNNPALSLYQNDPASPSGITFFGWNPALGAKTPFRDQRLRQALSMSFDRDTWINAFYNVDKFTSEGFPMQAQWNSALPMSDAGWWLDPKSKAFGANAKYFEFNPAEAKKLVAAAGFASGVDVEANYITGSTYGTDFAQQVETMKNFASDVGVRIKTNPVDVNEFQLKYGNAMGDFPGISFKGTAAGNPDVAEKAIQFHTPLGGPVYTGFYSPDSSFQKGDPKMTDLLLKTRLEFDLEKRQALIQDFQRMAAEQQYIIRFPGGSNGFSIAWPALRNFNVYRGDRLYYLGQWLDPTKKPLAN